MVAKRATTMPVNYYVQASLVRNKVLRMALYGVEAAWPKAAARAPEAACLGAVLGARSFTRCPEVAWAVAPRGLKASKPLTIDRRVMCHRLLCDQGGT